MQFRVVLQGGHEGCQEWDGHITREHLSQDMFPNKKAVSKGIDNTQEVLRRFEKECLCSEREML